MTFVTVWDPHCHKRASHTHDTFSSQSMCTTLKENPLYTFTLGFSQMQKYLFKLHYVTVLCSHSFSLLICLLPKNQLILERKKSMVNR